MKKILIPCFFLLFTFLLSSCAGREEVPPLDLTGEWKQVNSPDEGDYQGIYISEDGMEIFWILGSSDGAALYWAGSFTGPTEASNEDSYSWTSTAETSRTAKSLLTDKGKSKNFDYENGKLKYTVTYDGTVMTVIAKKEPWGYGELEVIGSTDMFDDINGVYQNFISGSGTS